MIVARIGQMVGFGQPQSAMVAAFTFSPYVRRRAKKAHNLARDDWISLTLEHGESVEYDACQIFLICCITNAEPRGDTNFPSDANRDLGTRLNQRFDHSDLVTINGS
jgi:hypothetical protein